VSAGTVIYAGGGSGGHIFPNLAVAERVRELAPGVQERWLVSERKVDASIAEANGLEAVPLPAAPLSIRPLGLLRVFARWGPSVRAARGVIRAAKNDGPVAVVASGGFVSAPAVFAAKAEGVWSALVNLDAALGKANRFAAGRASARFIVTTRAPSGWEPVAPVVRAAFDDLPSAEDARRSLGLEPEPNTLLVTGGSQGAASLNRALARVVREDPPLLTGWQVLHQASGDAAAEAEAAYAGAGVPARVVPFIDDMPAAWAAATLAVARAGAGTVAEARASRTPLVALPYPHHRDDHQLANMAAMVEAGAGTTVIDRADPEKTAPALRDELGHALGRLGAMRRAADALPPADGALAVAKRAARALRGER